MKKNIVSYRNISNCSDCINFFNIFIKFILLTEINMEFKLIP